MIRADTGLQFTLDQDIEVDVVGDLAKGAGVASGSKALQELAGLLGLATVKQVGAMLADRAIEDTRLGGLVDRVRDVINGVPAHAIRLYRVRAKLGKLKK